MCGNSARENKPAIGKRVEHILARYRSVLEQIDKAFETARHDNPGSIPCAPGCSHCCYALFAVRFIDAVLAWQGLSKFPAPKRRRYLDKIHRVLLILRHALPDFKQPFSLHQIGWRRFDDWVERFRIPCPLLDENGACAVHEYRPRICRLAGAVFVDTHTGDRLDDFCAIAKTAREQTGGGVIRFPLSQMDFDTDDLDRTLRHTLNSSEIPSGYTFLSAGLETCSVVLGNLLG